MEERLTNYRQFRTGITEYTDRRIEKVKRAMDELVNEVKYDPMTDTVRFQVTVDPMWITVVVSVREGNA